MDLQHIAAALVSAMLHAGWNAAIKASPAPRDAMSAQLGATAILSALALFWTGLPAPDSLLWIAASTLFNLSAIAALLKAYEGNGFGLAYPVCRAISVLLVTLLAAALWGETLSMAGLGGVGLIAAALLLIALGGRGDGAAHGGGLGWIAVSGAATAVYVLCDAHGVRQSGSPLAYGFTLSLVNGAVMCGVHRLRGGRWSTLTRHPGATTLNAVAALASYLLILWVWTGAAIAPATALRDTSAIFALLLAVLWLKEPFTPLKLAAILLAGAATPLLRFA